MKTTETMAELDPPSPETPISEAVDANRRLWDRWTAVHLGSDFYDVDGFRAGADSLCPVEIEEVGDVEGKSLLHLQCHFGLDTLSWARRGARVVGVDLSPAAIDVASGLAEELGLDARFLATDLYQLPDHLEGRFDRVVTSYGVLAWLPDLDAWARIVHHFLAEDGFFHVVEFHPILDTLGDDGQPFAYPYFADTDRADGGMIAYPEKGTYADREAEVEGTSHVWPHDLGEILSALLGAGLRLDFVREHAESPYDCFPFTREIAPGRAVVPGLEGRLPMLFSLRARRAG